MKYCAKLLVALSVIVAAPALIPGYGDCEARKPKKHYTKPSASKTASIKTVFKKSLGNYPYEVKLLTSPALKARLVKLMGQKRYNFMVKNFNVETPVELINGDYRAFACQAHNCGITDFSLNYSPDNDILSVKYNVDGKVTIFTENPAFPVNWSE